MTNFLVKSISSIFNKQIFKLWKSYETFRRRLISKKSYETLRRRLISKESLMSWGKNISHHNVRSSHVEVFCKKGVLRNFAKLAGKHLCQSLFFNKKEACNFI